MSEREGGARAIVTRNIRDFQSAALRFPHIRILSPEGFLRATHARSSPKISRR